MRGRPVCICACDIVVVSRGFPVGLRETFPSFARFVSFSAPWVTLRWSSSYGRPSWVSLLTSSVHVWGSRRVRLHSVSRIHSDIYLASSVVHCVSGNIHVLLCVPLPSPLRPVTAPSPHLPLSLPLSLPRPFTIYTPPLLLSRRLPTLTSLLSLICCCIIRSHLPLAYSRLYCDRYIHTRRYTVYQYRCPLLGSSCPSDAAL